MPTIGIVDDRADVRAVIADSLSLELPETWTIIDIDPLPNKTDYPSWIGANKISVLIIDERLNETFTTDAGAVRYFGHDLVLELRMKMTSFPIFVITSYPNDEELRFRFADVEDIIDRTAFSRNPASYAARFARASQRYLETFERELAELSDIAVKSATGANISTAERTRAKAIQEKINIAFDFEHIEHRSQWIEQMEATIQEFDQLRQELETLLTYKKEQQHEMEEDS